MHDLKLWVGTLKCRLSAFVCVCVCLSIWFNDFAPNFMWLTRVRKRSESLTFPLYKNSTIKHRFVLQKKIWSFFFLFFYPLSIFLSDSTCISKLQCSSLLTVLFFLSFFFWTKLFFFENRFAVNVRSNSKDGMTTEEMRKLIERSVGKWHPKSSQA